MTAPRFPPEAPSAPAAVVTRSTRSPVGPMMMLISPLGAKLSAAYGPKVTLAVGSLIIAAGYGIPLPLLGTTRGLLVVTLVVAFLIPVRRATPDGSGSPQAPAVPATAPAGP